MIVDEGSNISRTDEFLQAFTWNTESPGDPPPEGREMWRAGPSKPTGIKRRDVVDRFGEVVYEGNSGRVDLYIADPLGERDILKLVFADSTIRLLGHFGADGEFLEVHRTREG